MSHGATSASLLPERSHPSEAYLANVLRRLEGLEAATRGTPAPAPTFDRMERLGNLEANVGSQQAGHYERLPPDSQSPKMEMETTWSGPRHLVEEPEVETRAPWDSRMEQLDREAEQLQRLAELQSVAETRVQEAEHRAAVAGQRAWGPADTAAAEARLRETEERAAVAERKAWEAEKAGLIAASPSVSGRPDGTGTPR